VLEIAHLRKQFEKLLAVDDVSLTVEQGQIVGLIGPNGSGKSTLLNVTAGSLPADGGTVTFDGHVVTNRPANQIFDLGLARSFQDPALFTRMTVLDNMLLPVPRQRGEAPTQAPLHRRWRGEERRAATTAYNLLQQVNLQTHHDRPSADLSGGQMKLVALSRMLMGEPKLLLLDEPTAGVAPALAYTIFERIAELRDAGLTFLIVEHRLEILFAFVDYLYVMHLGKVIASGTPAEIERNAYVREVYFGE